MFPLKEGTKKWSDLKRMSWDFKGKTFISYRSCKSIFNDFLLALYLKKFYFCWIECVRHSTISILMAGITGNQRLPTPELRTTAALQYDNCDGKGKRFMKVLDILTVSSLCSTCKKWSITWIGRMFCISASLRCLKLSTFCLLSKAYKDWLIYWLIDWLPAPDT